MYKQINHRTVNLKIVEKYIVCAHLWHDKLICLLIRIYLKSEINYVCISVHKYVEVLLYIYNSYNNSHYVNKKYID